MTRNFIPHPTLRGEGRCRVCDLPYSICSEWEVRDHREYHTAHALARRAGAAPIRDAEREKLREEGLAMQRSPSFHDRVEGAEKWLIAKYHCYLFDVLRHGGPRLDLREYFTRRIEDRGLLRGTFDDDVAREMRFRYSDHFIS